jgi:hypothetical protein
VLVLPNPEKETYPHEMLDFCLDNEVNTVYILRGDEAHALAPAGQLFSEYGINLIVTYD